MQSTTSKKVGKITKTPSSEEASSEHSENQDALKKLTTKMMVYRALIDLKSRKGTSIYAIKKYIDENFNVNVEKINHIIKRIIKTDVEAGKIIQMKGIGASGSFKLAAGVGAEEKKRKPKKLLKKETTQKPTKETKTEPKAKKDDTDVTNKEKVKKTKKNTAKKKNAMSKRKSIGSIIKPPKMRPKASAT